MSISFKMDDTLQRIARQAVNKVQPGLIDAIEAEVRQIHDDAVREWPVGRYRRDRGGVHSRDRMAVEVVIDGDKVRGRVTNDAEWAPFIRANKLLGKSPYVELLKKPLRRARNKLVRELPREVTEILSDG